MPETKVSLVNDHKGKNKGKQENLPMRYRINAVKSRVNRGID